MWIDAPRFSPSPDVHSLSLQLPDEHLAPASSDSPRSNGAQWGGCVGDACSPDEALAQLLAPACSAGVGGEATTGDSDDGGTGAPASKRPKHRVKQGLGFMGSHSTCNGDKWLRETSSTSGYIWLGLRRSTSSCSSQREIGDARGGYGELW